MILYCVKECLMFSVLSSRIVIVFKGLLEIYPHLIDTQQLRIYKLLGGGKPKQYSALIQVTLDNQNPDLLPIYNYKDTTFQVTVKHSFAFLVRLSVQPIDQHCTMPVLTLAPLLTSLYPTGKHIVSATCVWLSQFSSLFGLSDQLQLFKANFSKHNYKLIP